MRSLFGTLIVSSAVAFPVYADNQTTPLQCDTLNIAVSFAFQGATSANAKNEVDSRLYNLNMFLLKNHIDKLETLSLSYKINYDQPNAQNNRSRQPTNVPPAPPMYKLTGTAEFQIDSSQNAFNIGQFLTQQNFQVTVSNKPNKNGPCPNTNVKTPPVTKPAVSAQSERDKELSTLLKQAPPVNAVEPAANSRNGAVPDLPGLQQDPPEAEPLNNNR